ncbi:hypothetical protein Lal_00018328 [Lupinus albus]|nr:hypothetical protein Lal_00018328 [Lupinus albus]
MNEAKEETLVVDRHKLHEEQIYYLNSLGGIKANWSLVMQNYRWLVGVGDKVNFWKENWLGAASVDQMRIPASLHSSLVARVSDFTIPKVFAEAFPHVVEEMVQVNIGRMQDKLIWQGTSDGTISLKAAFIFLKPAIEEQAWCKTIWSDFISPSKRIFKGLKINFSAGFRSLLG